MNTNKSKNKEKEQPDDLDKKKKILKTEHKKHQEESAFEEMLEEIQDDTLYHLMKKFK